MAGVQRFSNEQIIAALKRTRGMVYLAAQEIGCDVTTIQKRAKISPAIAEAIAAERGKVVDTAEQKLATAIDNGEPWAIQLVLKTLGKTRGYVERQEVTGKDGQSLQVQVVEELHDGTG